MITPFVILRRFMAQTASITHMNTNAAMMPTRDAAARSVTLGSYWKKAYTEGEL